MITLSNEDFLTLLNAANASGTPLKISIVKEVAANKPALKESDTEDALLLDAVLALPVSYKNRAGEVINTSVAEAWASTSNNGSVASALNRALSQLGMKITRKGTLFVCGTHGGLLSSLPEDMTKGVNSVLKRSPYNANGVNIFEKHTVAGQQIRGVEFTRQAYLLK